MPSDYAAISKDNTIRRGTEFDDIGDFLAEKLYSDRSHFIYELLQNAEDALKLRQEEVSDIAFPGSVTFRVRADCLKVSHFGRPFDTEDVRGISDVLRGTKPERRGQIGTFGIGFKSVYAFTQTPEVHSGDEHFRIERYIHPRAVERKPTEEGQTCFVFPFNHRDISRKDCRDLIKKGLARVGLHSIMFLEHVKELSWFSGRSAGTTYERSQKPVGGQGVQLELVEYRGTKETAREKWLAFPRNVRFPKSSEESALKIAFRLVANAKGGGFRVQPLNESRLFVYFPTGKETRLGFLLHGPFTPTPARDNIREDDPWNAKLIGESAKLLAESLEACRDLGYLTPGFLKALPIDEEDFPAESAFRPLYDAVLKAFRRQKLVPVSSRQVKHCEARWAVIARSKDVRQLIDSPDSLASLLGKKHLRYWVHESITEATAPVAWRYLRYNCDIPVLRPEDILSKVNDGFLSEQSPDWLVRLYSFCMAPGRYANIPKGCPLVRVEGGRMADTSSEAVFLPVSDGEPGSVFDPLGLPKQLQIPFTQMDRDLYAAIQKAPDSDTIIQWLKSKVGVRELTIKEYAAALYKSLKSTSISTLEHDELVMKTVFVACHLPDKDLSQLPILLDDGTVYSSCERGMPERELVVPEAYDLETGWQHIWVSEDDRKHFRIASRLYMKHLNHPTTFFERLRAVHFPSFQIARRDCGWRYDQYNCHYRHSWAAHFSHYQESQINSALSKSAITRVSDMQIEDVELPSSFKGPAQSREFGLTILAWMRRLPSQTLESVKTYWTGASSLVLIVHFENYGSRRHVAPSSLLQWLRTNSWLPTEKGLKQPNESFVSVESIKKILGNAVPYAPIKHDGKDAAICDLLGVNTKIDADTLVRLLNEQRERGNTADLELCRSIYRQIHNTCPELPKAFAEQRLIFAPRTGCSRAWFKRSEVIWLDRYDIFGDRFGYLKMSYPESTFKEFFCESLEVEKDVSVDTCLSWLVVASGEANSDGRKVSQVYHLLLDQLETEGCLHPWSSSPLLDKCREAFESQSLVFDRETESWYALGQCIWPDRKEVLGTDFAYLSEQYSDLKKLFQDILEIKLDVDSECYARRWLVLQECIATPVKQHVEHVIGAIYQELSSIAAKRTRERPVWWDNFAASAQILCEDGTFRVPGGCFLADDGELRRILSEGAKRPAFAYIPKPGTWKTWTPLLSSLGLKRVSQVVTRHRPAVTGEEPVDPDQFRFLTRPTVRLIYAWLESEKKNDEGEPLALAILQNTRESVVNGLQVSFTVKCVASHCHHEVEAYWDRETNPPKLYYVLGSSKMKAADAIIDGLLPNYSAADRDTLETLLGSDDAAAKERMEKRGWRPPPDIDLVLAVTGEEVLPDAEQSDSEEHHVDKNMVGEAQELCPHPVDGPQLPISPHPFFKRNRGHGDSGITTPRYDQESQIEQGLKQSDYIDSLGNISSYQELLNESFNKPAYARAEQNEDGDDWDDFEPGQVGNPERRRARTSERNREARAAEPLAEERRVETQRKLLEGPDPGVRETLFQWYGGKCQICGDTWPKRNQKPFYTSAYLVDRRIGRWLDNPGNALCLCPDHFAKWRHAAKQPPEDLVAQILEKRLSAEDGDDDLAIEFELNGKICTITYREAHFLALQELLKSSKDDE